MSASIRLARESDALAIADIYRPSVEAAVTSFEIEPPDAAEMRRRIAATLPQLPWLVCEVGSRVVGYVYASKHRERAAYRWSVDVAVYIDATCHRSGMGRGLYTSLLAIVAAQGYFNAYAGITLPNAASVALHESVGFSPVGIYRNVGYKFGAWRDVGWWQLTLKSHDEPPAEPMDVMSLAANRTDWEDLLRLGTRYVRAGGASV